MGVRWMKSMTGYGKGRVEKDGTVVHVELRAVNHRFLDIHVKLPASFLSMEEAVRNAVKQELERGHIDISVMIDGDGFLEKRVDIDWDLTDQYIHQWKKLKSHYDLTGEMTIDMVSKLDDVFSVKETKENTSYIKPVLDEAMFAALRALNKMRSLEGERIWTDLQARVRAMRALLKRMEVRRPAFIKEYRDRIKQRVEEFSREFIDPEESQLLKEIAILSEKGDVTEELTRMDSHLLQVERLLNEKGAVGRRLDFMIQEMHREVNTIGSKSNDSALLEIVIQWKNELEKMKEQVQNVE
ncbi:UNVERIFIED_CONTAM: YicC family protein [Halobacillus marinus]